VDHSLLSSEVTKKSVARSVDEKEEERFLEAKSQSRTIGRIKAGMRGSTTTNPIQSKHNLSGLLEDEDGNAFRHTTPPPIRRQASQRVIPTTDTLTTTRTRRTATRAAASRADSLFKAYSVEPYVFVSFTRLGD